MNVEVSPSRIMSAVISMDGPEGLRDSPSLQRIHRTYSPLDVDPFSFVAA
jgi:hypothetical protein